MRNFLYWIIVVFFVGLVGSEASAQTMQQCASVADPLGDVEMQYTTGTNPVETGRADLIGASLISEANGFLASASTSQPFQLHGEEKGNAVFMFDVDGVTENNSMVYEDVRGGADLYYIVSPNVSLSDPWTVRRYVVSASRKGWVRTQTSSTVDVTDANIAVHIPREELPLVHPNQWRAWISVAHPGSWLARDGVPTRSPDPSACGYLPVPDGQTMSVASSTKQLDSSSADLRPGLIGIVLFAVLAFVLSKIKPSAV